MSAPLEDVGEDDAGDGGDTLNSDYDDEDDD